MEISKIKCFLLLLVPTVVLITSISARPMNGDQDERQSSLNNTSAMIPKTKENEVEPLYCKKFYEKIENGCSEIYHNPSYMWISTEFVKALGKRNAEKASKNISFDDLVKMSLSQYFDQQKMCFRDHYYKAEHGETVSDLFKSVGQKFENWQQCQPADTEQEKDFLVIGSISISLEGKSSYDLYVFVHISADEKKRRNCSIRYFVKSDEGINIIIENSDEYKTALKSDAEVLEQCDYISEPEPLVEESKGDNMTMLYTFERGSSNAFKLDDFPKVEEMDEKRWLEDFRNRIASSCQCYFPIIKGNNASSSNYWPISLFNRNNEYGRTSSNTCLPSFGRFMRWLRKKPQKQIIISAAIVGIFVLFIFFAYYIMLGILIVFASAFLLFIIALLVTTIYYGVKGCLSCCFRCFFENTFD